MSKEPSLFPDLPLPDPVLQPTPRSERAPRLLVPQRNQIELRPVDLEATLAPEPPARSVWAFVEGLDLSALYGDIGSVEGRARRAAIDPRILMALWLYATIDGVGSAREIERLTQSHDGYRWICGGVNVNHHTLSDFRCARLEVLEGLLTHSVAVLLEQGRVQLDRVAQDGMRVRAGAGAASFRRRSTLAGCLEEAEQQIEALRAELDADPQASQRRRQAAQLRAAEQRTQRVSQALQQLADIEQRKKKPPPQKDTETEEAHAKRTEPRASSTDPEARVMRWPTGAFARLTTSSVSPPRIAKSSWASRCATAAAIWGSSRRCSIKSNNATGKSPRSGSSTAVTRATRTSNTPRDAGPRCMRRCPSPKTRVVTRMSRVPRTARPLAAGASAWAVPRPSPSTPNARRPPSVSTPSRGGAGCGSLWSEVYAR